jgi:hypothetical protein
VAHKIESRPVIGHFEKSMDTNKQKAEMSLFHHKSEPVHDLIAKSMHSLKGTQVDSEASYRWQIINSQESASASTEGSVLSFLSPASAPGILTLWSDSYIEVKAYFLNAAVLTLGTTATAVIPALSNFVFSDYEISFNGTVVRPSTGFVTPWGVFVDTIINENKAYVDNRAYTQGYLWDTYNTAGNALNAGAQLRTAGIAGAAAASATRPFSLFIPLRALGIRTSDAIPPQVEVRMRCTRSSNSLLTFGADSGTTLPVFTMNSCRLFMRQLRLTQEASAALSMSLQKEAARMNYQRVKMFSQYFPLGTQEVSVNQCLPGPRPSRVVCAIIQQNSLSGAQTANPLEILPEGTQVLSNIYITVNDSRYYPVQSYSQAANANMHNTLDWAEAYEMYASICASKDCALPDAQFSNMMWLCFDTSKSGDPVGVADIQEETAIDFHCAISAAPAAAFSALVFSWTDSVIEIDGNGSVAVDA